MDNQQTPPSYLPPQEPANDHLYHDVPHPGGVMTTKRGKNKRLMVAGAASALVLIGGGYFFGFYIPNKPVNVFKAALNNTSAGYDQLVNYATDGDVAKKFKNSEMEGDYKVVAGGVSTDGTMSAHYDGKSATFSGDLGLGITRLKVDGLMKDVENSESPDLYIKAGGIKGLGAMYGMPDLDTLDDQWIVIDHSLFDTLAQQTEQAQGLDAKDEGVKLPTKDDVVDAARVIGKESDKYLFSSDKDTAVLTMDSFVGKETVDSKNTNHYKVKANKDHLKAFTKDLGKELDKTKLSKWTKDNYDKPLSEIVDVKSMQDSANDIKSGDRFDVWVNTKTKLVHKIRFSDSKDAAHNYTEFGLNYDGGAEKPFFLTLTDNKDGIEGKGTFSLTLNTDTNVVKFKLDGVNKSSDGSQDEDMKVNMTFKPSDGGVDTTAPAGAISLSEALDKIGLSGYLDLLTQSLGQQLQDQGTDASSSDPFTISL
jgi:hypothetical protein